jgi:hypothetical protein
MHERSSSSTMCRFEFEARVDLGSGSFVFPSTRSPIGRLVSCEESVAELNLDCVSGKSQFPSPQSGSNCAREQRSKTYSKTNIKMVYHTSRFPQYTAGQGQGRHSRSMLARYWCVKNSPFMQADKAAILWL